MLALDFLLRLYSDSYCVESRFQLGMLRLLDEYMFIVDVLYDVYVAIFGVDFDDDGFDGGVTLYEHTLHGHQHISSSPGVSFRHDFHTLLSARHDKTRGTVKDVLSIKMFS